MRKRVMCYVKGQLRNEDLIMDDYSLNGIIFGYLQNICICQFIKWYYKSLCGTINENKHMKEIIGKHIKELRIDKLGVTQEQFAAILNVDRTYLSRVESGKQNLTIDTLSMICEKLDISLVEFFKGIDENA